jgi:starch synthase
MNINVMLVSNQVRGVDGAGGLGDVPVGLGKTLRARGDVDVRVIMPGFEEISGKDLENRFEESNLVLAGMRVPLGDTHQTIDVYQITVPGSTIPCYLLRCPEVFNARDPHTSKLNKDTADKAILFSRSVVEFLAAYESFRVDLLHCNDWNAGLIPVYLKTLYRADHYLGRIATIFTTHNAGGDAFQGGFREAEALLRLAGLTSAGVFEGGAQRSLHHNDKFNFSKGGFGFTDILNTVSTQYRLELLTPAFAGGLEGLFQARATSFTGIVNGIDTEEWNPAIDAVLGSHVFKAGDSLEVIQARKRSIRSALRQWTVPTGGRSPHTRAGERPFEHLQDDSVLIGVVSRIDYQKCPILVRVIRDICALPNVQVAMLGNANPNDPLGQEYERTFREAQSGSLSFFDGFDIPLSHLIYAASEIFLVPSVFEPCGLTQLVAMRYGSIPIVRSVGGLVDTVIDEADASRWTMANGFHFKEEVPVSNMVDEEAAGPHLVSAVQRALNVHATRRWRDLVKNAMARDSSWTVPGAQYVKLYHEAISRCVSESFLGG